MARLRWSEGDDSAAERGAPSPPPAVGLSARSTLCCLITAAPPAISEMAQKMRTMHFSHLFVTLFVIYINFSTFAMDFLLCYDRSRNMGLLFGRTVRIRFVPDARRWHSCAEDRRCRNWLTRCQTIKGFFGIIIQLKQADKEIKHGLSRYG